MRLFYLDPLFDHETTVVLLCLVIADPEQRDSLLVLLLLLLGCGGAVGRLQFWLVQVGHTVGLGHRRELFFAAGRSVV